MCFAYIGESKALLVLCSAYGTIFSTRDDSTEEQRSLTGLSAGRNGIKNIT